MAAATVLGVSRPPPIRGRGDLRSARLVRVALPRLVRHRRDGRRPRLHLPPPPGGGARPDRGARRPLAFDEVPLGVISLRHFSVTFPGGLALTPGSLFG